MKTLCAYEKCVMGYGDKRAKGTHACPVCKSAIYCCPACRRKDLAKHTGMCKRLREADKKSRSKAKRSRSKSKRRTKSKSKRRTKSKSKRRTKSKSNNKHKRSKRRSKPRRI